MKNRLLIIGLVFISKIALAQTTTFFKTNEGIGHSVVQTADSGFVVAGSKEGDICIFKVDALGDVLFTKQHGSVFGDVAKSLVPSFDGGYIITGTVGKPDTMMEGSTDVILLKTNEFCDTLWTKTWGLIPDTLPDEGLGDYGYSVFQTRDSGYVVTGMYNNSVNWIWTFPPSAFLRKLDSSGDTMWEKTYPDFDVAYSVVQTHDEGYVFAGDNGVMKTDSLGNSAWIINNIGTGYSVIPTSDSNFVVTGSNGDVILMKFDISGNEIWMKSFDRGCNNSDFGYSVDECSDGGFIITGGTNCSEYSQSTNSDIWIIKTDSEGDTLWTKNYGGPGNEVGTCVKQCFDQGFIVTGNTSGTMFLLKTDSLGNAPALDSKIELPEKNKSNVTIFPNPTIDYINISFSDNQDRTVIVYSATGKQLLKNILVKGQRNNRLDLSSLSEGLYFIKILSNDFNFSVHKLIISK